MYDDIYTLNFVSSFILSSIFICLSIIFSFIFSFNLTNSKKKYLYQYQPIIIFFLIFCFYAILFNSLILTNFRLLSVLFYLILFSKIIYILTNYKIIFKILNLEFFVKKKLIFIFFLIFYLIAILPISDADSIVVFQNIPAVIFQSGLKGLNLARDIEFTSFSNTETLLLLSSILKSDNFGAQLNLISLIFLICITYKENKNFLLIIFSSPLIIYFVSSQKLQLFFGVLYLLLFILIHKKTIQEKIELFFVVLLLTFYSSGKITYILFSAPLFLYLLKNNIKYYKDIFLYLLISFLIIYAPLLSIKQIYFGNILAPFFDNLFGKNNEIYNAYALSLRSIEGWLTNPTNLSLYLRPFISFELSKISGSLGLIFFTIFNYKLQKQLKYFPAIIVVLILLTGQILPRYYFEAFLLLAFFYQINLKFVKLIIYSQLVAVFSLTIIFIYISYFQLNIFKDKKNYLNRFSYSFFNAQQLKKDNLNGNILDFSLDRNSIFFEKNVYSFRYLNMINKYKNNNNQNLNNFILNNSIKYLIIYSNYQIPDCLITKEIKETNRKRVVRNFFNKTIENKYKIMEIRDNKCTY